MPTHDVVCDERAFVQTYAERRRDRFVHRYSATHARLLRATHRALLYALATPHLGSALVRTLEALAWPSNLPVVGGSICLHTRHSRQLLGRVKEAQDDSTPLPLGSAVLAGSLGDLFEARMVDGLYIGRSAIHGRGLFTARDLPSGTCIFTEPQRTLLAAPSYLRLLSDTSERLPDTWHYTHPSGVLLELVTQPQPHHVMNHSCSANVCSGLSRAFWEAVLDYSDSSTCGSDCLGDRLSAATMQPTASSTTRRAGERGQMRSHRSHPRHSRCSACTPTKDEDNSTDDMDAVCVRRLANLSERVRHWSGYDNPNSYFVTRDVHAGEELTLNYRALYAPMYRGERARWVICHCGSEQCTQFVYGQSPELRRYLCEAARAASWMSCLRSPTSLAKAAFSTTRTETAEAACAVAGRTTSSMKTCRSHQSATSSDAKRSAASSCFHVARKLFALGLEDETAVLSCLPSLHPLVRYAWGDNDILPQIQAPKHVSLMPASSTTTPVLCLLHSQNSDKDAVQCQKGDAVQVASGDGGFFFRPSQSTGGGAAEMAVDGVSMQTCYTDKFTLMSSYRHVFRVLNEAKPMSG